MLYCTRTTFRMLIPLSRAPHHNRRLHEEMMLALCEESPISRSAGGTLNREQLHSCGHLGDLLVVVVVVVVVAAGVGVVVEGVIGAAVLVVVVVVVVVVSSRSSRRSRSSSGSRNRSRSRSR